MFINEKGINAMIQARFDLVSKNLDKEQTTICGLNPACHPFLYILWYESTAIPILLYVVCGYSGRNE